MEPIFHIDIANLSIKLINLSSKIDSKQDFFLIWSPFFKKKQAFHSPIQPFNCAIQCKKPRHSPRLFVILLKVANYFTLTRLISEPTRTR